MQFLTVQDIAKRISASNSQGLTPRQKFLSGCPVMPEIDR
jgi:hypothetical protein